MTNTHEPKSRRQITWLITLIVWASALVIAAGASYFSKLNMWICFGIVIVAWVINSIAAEIEDRLPGGFLNPKNEAQTSILNSLNNTTSNELNNQ